VTATQITFNSPWYFYLASAVAGVLVAAGLYLYNKRNKDAPYAVRALLFSIRFLTVSFICLLLLNVFLKQTKNQTENPVILLALDNSASMVAAKDSLFVKQGLIEDIAGLKEAIGGKYEVKTILFGERSRNQSAPDFKDKETDLDELFRELDNNYSGQNIGALVLVSDGIYNRGANPLFSARRLSFPVFAVACGDTTENRDAAIVQVNHNQVAYLGNNFPAEVVVNARKLSGQELRLGLYNGNNLVSETRLKVVSDNFTATHTFTLTAGKVGIQTYNVVLQPVVNEKNLGNNRRVFAVDVIDNRDKILMVAKSPHPDLAAIKDAFTAFENYELKLVMGENYNQSLKEFAMVIIHGFDQLHSELLAACRANGVPFWIINPQVNDRLPGVEIRMAINRTNDAEPVFDGTFELFNVSAELKKFGRDLPAVKTFFGNYVVSPGVTSLIQQRIGSVETDNPLQYFGEQNGLKYSVFLGDGLWRWRLRDFVEHASTQLFNELVVKTVQYLSVKSDKSFFRITQPRILNENEPLVFGAEVYNKSYEAITEPDVALVVINKAGKRFNYTFSKTGNVYQLNAGRFEPGEYSFEASVNTAGGLLVKKGIFTVREVVSENLSTVANHNLLYQLGSRSGGGFYYPADLKKLETELLQSEKIKPVTFTERSVSHLIELRWLLALILLFAGAEWFIRKRYLHI